MQVNKIEAPNNTLRFLLLQVNIYAQQESETYDSIYMYASWILLGSLVSDRKIEFLTRHT